MNRTPLLIPILTWLHVFSSQAAAAGLELPRNGWASWEVPAVADAPAWCCHESRSTPATKPTCKLDEKDHGYVSRDDSTTTAVRIYARFADGKLERLRSLAADCPVQTNSEIRTLAASEQASVEWLTSLLEGTANTDKRSRSDIMAALAVHRTPLAYDVLARVGRRADDFQQRKDAVFWLAHVRGQEGANLTTTLMFEDTDARMREHAAFALTLSTSPRIAEDLARLATTDREYKVRGQAWFWLAHTKAPQTERAIDTALRQETDQRVREQAIFALSRLPEERATRALVSVIENQAFSPKDRKKAIFWLGQAGTDSAIAYLDKLLDAPVQR